MNDIRNMTFYEFIIVGSYEFACLHEAFRRRQVVRRFSMISNDLLILNYSEL